MLLANPGFIRDAESASSNKGMPVLRFLPLNVACESTVIAEIEEGTKEAMPHIIEALTKPLTEHERAPKWVTEPLPRIAFKGSYQDINRFYYRNGWTDGLPIVPPTEEAVKEMLQGTDLSPDHLVAEVIPRHGKATIEKIAINAVMAGALPTHMPVIIAAVETLSDQKTRFDTFEVSTGSWAPFFIINGPIRDQIHVNYGSGALSPGDIANSAIGRAIGLIVKNIGGARKGVEDMGVIGNPLKYSLVIGEDEDKSPWEPLHVDRGFNRHESTVTVFFPNIYTQAVPKGTDAKGIADTMKEMNPWSMSCFIVIPSHAEILASEGWTKEDLKAFLMKGVESPMAAYRQSQGGTTEAKDILSAPPLATDPESLMIIVAGGPGAWTGLLKSVGGIENDFVSRKITLPKNWEKLVKKYSNIVPSYARY
ncbi:MAG: hypothetical protein GX846_01230 [Deltaproteobacteria bacterium]|nr:hypothetical protein [Deltaproteobacteria bacterium]